jgi:hypothetical protein
MRTSLHAVQAFLQLCCFEGRWILLQLSRLVEVQLVAALELLGIESPEKM